MHQLSNNAFRSVHQICLRHWSFACMPDRTCVHMLLVYHRVVIPGNLYFGWKVWIGTKFLSLTQSGRKSVMSQVTSQHITVKHVLHWVCCTVGRNSACTFSTVLSAAPSIFSVHGCVIIEGDCVERLCTVYTYIYVLNNRPCPQSGARTHARTHHKHIIFGHGSFLYWRLYYNAHHWKENM